MRIQLKRLLKALNGIPKPVLKRLHDMGKIHKEKISLSNALSENAILMPFVCCDFIACQAKKKEFFVTHRD